MKTLINIQGSTIIEAPALTASLVNSKPKKTTKSSQKHKHNRYPTPESTRLLALAEEVARFGSWEWDVSKPRAVWSRELFRIFGLEPQNEGLTLEEFRSFIHPDDLAEVSEKMQNAFIKAKVGQKSELDYRIIRPDGSVRIIHSQRQVKALNDEGKLKIVVGVDQDVTQQRAAEQINTENTKLLALAEQMADFGSWELSTTYDRAIWSPGMFRIFGIELGTKVGLNWEEYSNFIHPDDRAAAVKNAQIMFNSPLNHRENFDYRIIRSDGQTRVLHGQRQVTEVDTAGKAKVVVGVDQDVTEQRQAVEALKQSEERFRIVAEAANVMVYEVQLPQRKIRFVNGIEKLTGYKQNELGTSPQWVYDHMHPDDVEGARAKFLAAVEQPNIEQYSNEYRIRHKDGGYLTVKDTGKIIRDSAGNALLMVGGVRDITQRKQDQEKIRQYNKHLEQLVIERSRQLVEYERLAAIGQIAGMVGHDIRNPLQALTGEVYLIRTELDNVADAETKDSINESLDSVDENVGYINKIVADLQDYSRKLHPENSEVAINSLISEVFKGIKVPNKIQLAINVDSAPKVKADPTFLRRALTNLINNAIQAMPDGGKLTVNANQADNHVCITVADTGVGIEESLKKKLFTPLFTTKAKGQGLGLAVVKRLVEAQGGSICFDSQVGAGTKFVIKLPTKHP